MTMIITKEVEITSTVSSTRLRLSRCKAVRLRIAKSLRKPAIVGSFWIGLTDSWHVRATVVI